VDLFYRLKNNCTTSTVHD